MKVVEYQCFDKFGNIGHRPVHVGILRIAQKLVPPNPIQGIRGAKKKKARNPSGAGGDYEICCKGSD